jgi:hypothetical protein
LEGIAGLYTGFKVTLGRNIVYNIAQWSTFPIALALLTGSADATPKAARAIRTDLASEMAAVSDKESAREFGVGLDGWGRSEIVWVKARKKYRDKQI